MRQRHIQPLLRGLQLTNDDHELAEEFWRRTRTPCAFGAKTSHPPSGPGSPIEWRIHNNYEHQKLLN